MKVEFINYRRNGCIVNDVELYCLFYLNLSKLLLWVQTIFGQVLIYNILFYLEF